MVVLYPVPLVHLIMKLGQSDESACTKCPVGTFSSELGASAIDKCLPCPPGTFSDEDW